MVQAPSSTDKPLGDHPTSVQRLLELAHNQIDAMEAEREQLRAELDNLRDIIRDLQAKLLHARTAYEIQHQYRQEQRDG